MINIAILRCNSLHFIFFFTITAGEKFKDFRFLGIPEVSGIMFFFFCFPYAQDPSKAMEILSEYSSELAEKFIFSLILSSAHMVHLD